MSIVIPFYDNRKTDCGKLSSFRTVIVYVTVIFFLSVIIFKYL